MTLSRRQAIRRAAALAGGATLCPLLTPFLQRVRAHSEDGRRPLRFVFVVKSSGLTPAELVPQEWTDEYVTEGQANQPGPNYRQALQLNPSDELIQRSLAKCTMHESLAPLQPSVIASRLFKDCRAKCVVEVIPVGSARWGATVPEASTIRAKS